MNDVGLVQVRGLSKTFGDLNVLADLDLCVGRRDFLGLVGPNGSGKSTLLRILVGLHRRTRGDCAVFGLDPEREPIAVRSRLSYLPGETSVYREMTGAQFLEFAVAFHAHVDATRTRRLTELFALPMRQRVRAYSAGMKQKLAVLAALAVDAELYLLDEPDRALDATMRMELRGILREMWKQGATFVLSSHHLEELRDLASRLQFLRSGRWIADAELRVAEAALRQRARVRLTNDAPPQGARIVRRCGDGSWIIECDGDPLAWIAAQQSGATLAFEAGDPRLDDLYELLYLPQQPAEPSA